jgi:O-antigen ligase
VPLVGAAALVAVGAGYAIGHSQSAYLGIALTVATGFVLLVLLRRDEMIAATIVAVGIIIDDYQLVALPGRLPLAGIGLAGLLVAVLFLTQSPSRPWVRVPNLWLWVLVLALSALAIPRDVFFADGLKYFATTLINSALLYVIGVQVARDLVRFRWLLIGLGVFAALMAVHTIIQGTTGIFLFITPQWSAWLNYKGGYAISGGTSRAGSFLINPDDNGVFMAMMLPILVGLAGGLRRWAWRLAAGVGAGLVLLGLFFTFSNASWIAVGVGAVVYVLLVARGRTRVILLVGGILAFMAITVGFPQEYQALLAHATRQRELELRIGAWETGLRVIQAFPLTGLGLGYQTYTVYADPFRAPLQNVTLTHPHNSYIEVAAMAGLPAGLLWLVILGGAFWRGVRLLMSLKGHQRALVGGVMVALIIVAVNSLATDGWTLAPQVIPDWLLLGAISSPALARAFRSDSTSDTTSASTVAAAGASTPVAEAREMEMTPPHGVLAEQNGAEASSGPSEGQRLLVDKALR